MATNSLSSSFKMELKKRTLKGSWKLLDKKALYDNTLHYHACRQNTMPTTVSLYEPALRAIWYYANKEPLPGMFPFRLVKSQAISTTGTDTRYALEVCLPDQSSLVITVMSNSVRISHCFADPATYPTFSNDPILPFSAESPTAITYIFLAMLPVILEKDISEYNGKLWDTVKEIGAVNGASVWVDKNDIPDIVQNAFYATDCIMSLYSEIGFTFSDNAASTVAQEVPDSLLDLSAMVRPLR